MRQNHALFVSVVSLAVLAGGQALSQGRAVVGFHARAHPVSDAERLNARQKLIWKSNWKRLRRCPLSLPSRPRSLLLSGLTQEDVRTIRADFPFLVRAQEEWARGIPEAVAAKANVSPQFHQLPSSLAGEGAEYIYFDNAATTHKPRSVLREICKYYQRTNSNVHRGAHRVSVAATEAYENARSEVAAFIGAESPREVIFTSGATDGINLVAHTLGEHICQTATANGGSEVILTPAEHHANIVPWQLLARRANGRVSLKYTRLKAGTHEVDVGHLLSLITPRTRLVSVAHISNVLATRLGSEDIRRISTETRRRNIPLLLDACQSVPHEPVNVREMGVDLMTFSAHKMLGPTGVGVLWGRGELLERLPPWKGGGEMIEDVLEQESTFAPPPLRFEAGTPPVAQAVGLAAACRYMGAVGMRNIQEYEARLGAQLQEVLRAVPGLRVLGPASPSIPLRSFTADGLHHSDVASLLDQEAVAVRADEKLPNYLTDEDTSGGFVCRGSPCRLLPPPRTHGGGEDGTRQCPRERTIRQRQTHGNKCE
eukprot:GHVU01147683.1.p1 GENE.GHVU01147683.1~~GHVU01147683.1.p1  ORF type:complete len:541 (-),score=65.30 GHVU01147683.1:105-1727(-)